MKSNFNDLIDIILTFVSNEELSKSIVVSGSIVPYLAVHKDSNEFHDDFCFLVKEKKIKRVRYLIDKLSYEYEFDIISDSNKLGDYDHGFAIKYQDSTAYFFPYSIVNNVLKIGTYYVDYDNNQISYKTKTIPSIRKEHIIKLIKFDKYYVRILSPEFILVQKENTEKNLMEKNLPYIKILNKISDDEIIELIRKSMKKESVNINTLKIKKNEKIIIIVLSIVFVILLIIGIIIFKK